MITAPNTPVTSIACHDHVTAHRLLCRFLHLGYEARTSSDSKGRAILLVRADADTVDEVCA